MIRYAANKDFNFQLLILCVILPFSSFGFLLFHILFSRDESFKYTSYVTYFLSFFKFRLIGTSVNKDCSFEYANQQVTYILFLHMFSDRLMLFFLLLMLFLLLFLLLLLVLLFLLLLFLMLLLLLICYC